MAKSIFEEALASLGAAIADVREKVVEEGYFGRVVTNDSPAEVAPAESNAFDVCLAVKLQVDPSPANTDKTHDNPEPGGGMEH